MAPLNLPPPLAALLQPDFYAHRPDAVELEFGVKLTAETGAIIAKGAAEGHLVVRLSWTPGQNGPAPETAAR